jgi:molybdenum cofactor biosynthesis enzyme MoaA
MTHPKNFCAMPWHHLMVRTNGDYAVCCQHKQKHPVEYNINNVSHDQWLQSDYLQEVKQTFQNDERHPGCHVCWKYEDNGYASMRNRTQKEYEILGIDINNPSLLTVEVDLGNVCNLKCLICGENNSSSLLYENKQLGLNKHEQSDFAWSDRAIERVKEIILKKPKVINVRGGEPFYEKRLLKILQEISDEDAKKIVLHITTNATIWTESWKAVLSKFKLVRFMFSIDAFGVEYEYVRYPANWNTVKENVKQMQKLPNAKCLVHAVVMNMNILNIKSLIEWCQENNLFLDLELIQKPSFCQIDNLPDNLKQKAIEHVESILSMNNLDNHVRVLFDQCKKDLIASTNLINSNWIDFLEYVKPRDNLRNTSYKTVIK